MATTDLARVSNGHDDAAAVLQAALDKGGHVRVPMGVYKVGRTLRIRSNTRLDVHPEARLLLGDGVGKTTDDFLLTNANHDAGDENIEIRGGIWDGNNRNNPRSKAAEADPLSDPGGYSGVLVNFRNVRRLTFGHCRLCDSESYHFRATQLGDFLIRHVKIDTTNPRPNNDGIHLGGFCQRGVIAYITGQGRKAPNDDLVALNADDALGRIECHGKLNGYQRDIVVHDLQADDCHSFVRILSTDSRVERLQISGIRGGCREAMVNMDGARGCRVQVFDAQDPKYANGVGDCDDIRVSDARVWKTQKKGPLIRLQQRSTRLVIEDVLRDPERDSDSSSDTIHAEHLPGHVLTVEDEAGNLQTHEFVDSASSFQRRSGGFRRLSLDRA